MERYVTLILVLALPWLVPLPDRLDATDSRLVRYKDGATAFVTLSGDERRRLPGDDQVDARFVEALLAKEDRRFYWHLGIDPIAVVRALVANLRQGHVVQGGSTLTLQVVRVLEPRPRTLRSKLIEALRALQLEARMSKREILQVYLRFAPYGRNIEGVRAASFAFFGHDATALTAKEIATLVDVPQDPNHRHPAELRPFPREAPHVSEYLLRKQPALAAIDSTLDRGITAMAERTLTSYRPELARLGIHNGSVVIVDLEDASVVAAIGNLAFDDKRHHGEVAGFLAPRSTGSTLKPVLYAMAIDQGLVLPSYRVLDVPIQIAGYEPKNYDERFRGLVRIDEALQQSLNIPFVNLLHELGVGPFLSTIERAGLGSIGDEKRYGLSAAIGGIDASLLELTGLYATLASGGKTRPLRMLTTQMKNEGDVLFSPGASYLTRRALTGRDRPDFPLRRESVRLAPSFFWKTGTSYGHRDAWAIGANDRFAIGVWLGNFDGTAAHALVGGERAGPLLFDLFDALSNRVSPSAVGDLPPPDLSEVEVCALSGRMAEPHCPHKTRVWGKTSDLPTERCPYHQKVEVASGFAVCPICRIGKASEERIYTVLPASARRYVDFASGAPVPPHDPTCHHGGLVARTPKIRLPQSGTTFFLMPGLPRDHQRIPLEVDGPDDASLDWFVDGVWIGPATPHARQWLEPRPGKRIIRVVDRDGHADTIAIEIRESG